MLNSLSVGVRDVKETDKRAARYQSCLTYLKLKRCIRCCHLASSEFASVPMSGDLDCAVNDIYFGSSRDSGEGLADLEEEVVVIAEAVGGAFENLDLVVNAFEQAGV